MGEEGEPWNAGWASRVSLGGWIRAIRHRMAWWSGERQNLGWIKQRDSVGRSWAWYDREVEG